MAAEQTSDLIDSRVSAKQCQRALDALLKHARASEKKREENELLPGKEQHVWLVLAVKQMYPEKKLKPFKMWLATLLLWSYILTAFLARSCTPLLTLARLPSASLRRTRSGSTRILLRHRTSSSSRAWLAWRS